MVQRAKVEHADARARRARRLDGFNRRNLLRLGQLGLRQPRDLRLQSRVLGVDLLEVVQLLLRWKGPNECDSINHKNKAGMTALMVAVMRRNVGVAIALMQEGASVVVKPPKVMDSSGLPWRQEEFDHMNKVLHELNGVPSRKSNEAVPNLTDLAQLIAIGPLDWVAPLPPLRHA